MTFKTLLERWDAAEAPSPTVDDFAVKLTLEDAARVYALAEMFDGVATEHIVTDLMTAALDEVQAAIPYEPGDKVIREDEFGDPVYADTGRTPEFLELVRKYKRKLQSG